MAWYQVDLVRLLLLGLATVGVVYGQDNDTSTEPTIEDELHNYNVWVGCDDYPAWEDTSTISPNMTDTCTNNIRRDSECYVGNDKYVVCVCQYVTMGPIAMPSCMWHYEGSTLDDGTVVTTAAPTAAPEDDGTDDHDHGDGDTDHGHHDSNDTYSHDHPHLHWHTHDHNHSHDFDHHHFEKLVTPIGCPSLPPLENGYLTYKHFKTFTFSALKCNPGYVPEKYVETPISTIQFCNTKTMTWTPRPFEKCISIADYCGYSRTAFNQSEVRLYENCQERNKFTRLEVTAQCVDSEHIFTKDLTRTSEICCQCRLKKQDYYCTKTRPEFNPGYCVPKDSSELEPSPEGGRKRRRKRRSIYKRTHYSKDNLIDDIQELEAQKEMLKVRLKALLNLS